MASVLRKTLSPSIREIRILCCQTSASSLGTRQFVINTYETLKKANPDLPIMIREAKGTPARAFARFERGVERHVSLEGLDEKSVGDKIGELVTNSSTAA
ncbi:NADH dehydrogenase, alpha subcomplex, subunit 2 [Sistotremastrum niveocremeum HHB9708]|uniref:NADH dehydrogenase, alpha subcomplex, subunit 2 n=1 Tax=Sistotremastrum niveocremeum HHB9708 TaxID=1314777 RepID=A0A164MVG5_9AGAM|nr:NADH dehydrogenase, alpha subcomplex, subunit 2 [Sistotremastrum niveocremeum HHB9708]